MIYSVDYQNWYWFIAGDSSKVYSSARNIMVPIGDDGYQKWLSNGYQTPLIEDEAGLWSVMTNGAPGYLPTWLFNGTTFIQPGLGAYTQDQLVGYANVKQWSLAIGGYTVTLNGNPYRFNSDPVSMTLLTGKSVRLAQPNPPAEINWQFGATTWVTISAADFLTIAIEVADFVQSTFDTLKTVEAGIAGGIITTIQMIDGADWPADHA